MYSYSFVKEPFKFEKISLNKPSVLKFVITTIVFQTISLFCLFGSIYFFVTGRSAIMADWLGALLLFLFFQFCTIFIFLATISFIRGNPKLLEEFDLFFPILSEHFTITYEGLALLSFFSHTPKKFYPWKKIGLIELKGNEKRKLIIRVMRPPGEVGKKEKRRTFVFNNTELSQNDIDIELLFNSVKQIWHKRSF